MKKKLISLLMTAAMVGSMMSGMVASAAEETEAATEATTEAASEAAGESTGGGSSDSLEDVSEPVTLSLMVTTRPSTDAKDFYLDWLPELVHERFPNITIEVEQLPTDQYKQTVRLRFASGEGPDLFTWWA